MPVIRVLLLFFLVAGISSAIPGPAGAGKLPDIISAPDAYGMMQAGDLLLIDIRSPREWDTTGVAKGAIPITVHQRGFAAALLEAVGGDRSRAIAIICATGGRTAIAKKYLERMGFTAVTDVTEGMLGSDRGPGWIRRGLPVVAHHEQ